MKAKALKAAFPLTIPVLMGYLFLGMAFGILLESKGYNFIWAIAMSMIVYAGSMQFVAINLLSGGATILYTAFITLMVNARHLFYGLSLLDKYKKAGAKKPYLIFALSDETFSLVSSAKPPEGVDPHWFYFFISILDQGYWITGSILGSLIGSLVTFNTTGIDFVMTALFVVIFLNQWMESKEHRPALIGIVVSVLCLVIFGTGNFIIPAMIGIILFLSIFKKNIELVEAKVQKIKRKAE